MLNWVENSMHRLTRWKTSIVSIYSSMTFHWKIDVALVVFLLQWIALYSLLKLYLSCNYWIFQLHINCHLCESQLHASWKVVANWWHIIMKLTSAFWMDEKHQQILFDCWWIFTRKPMWHWITSELHLLAHIF
jgi:hypothetical protein